MDDIRLLRRLFPSANGLTVFDADTQETSYGIARIADTPFIFDTHRKGRMYVATLELLTEGVRPVRVPSRRVEPFVGLAHRRGLLPIPYSGCYFRGNLHVYSFSGPVRGFDLATVGRSAGASEDKLIGRIRDFWPSIPREILRGQELLLAKRRAARYPDDLRVLLRSPDRRGP